MAVVVKGRGNMFGQPRTTKRTLTDSECWLGLREQIQIQCGSIDRHASNASRISKVFEPGTFTGLRTSFTDLCKMSTGEFALGLRRVEVLMSRVAAYNFQREARTVGPLTPLHWYVRGGGGGPPRPLSDCNVN